MLFYLTLQLLPVSPEERILAKIFQKKVTLGSRNLVLQLPDRAAIATGNSIINTSFLFYHLHPLPPGSKRAEEKAQLRVEKNKFFVSFAVRSFKNQPQQAFSSPFFKDKEGVPLDQVYLAAGQTQYNLGAWQQAKKAWQQALVWNPFQTLAQGLLLEKIYFNTALPPQVSARDNFFADFFVDGPGKPFWQLKQSARAASDLTGQKAFLSTEEKFISALGGEKAIEDLDWDPEAFCPSRKRKKEL